MDEKFFILPHSATHWRLEDAMRREARLPHALRDALYHIGMHCIAGDHTPRLHLFSSRLELRLDERYQLCLGRHESHHRRHHHQHTDERKVQCHYLGKGWELVGGEVPQVGALHYCQPRVLPEGIRHQRGAHVNTDDVGGPAMKQAVGEAAGGQARIQGHESPYIHPEVLQGSIQLVPCPGRPAGLLAFDSKFRVRVNHRANSVHRFVLNQHLTLEDQGCQLPLVHIWEALDAQIYQFLFPLPSGDGSLSVR
mmetsp:Transcript_635/g.1859  ORF Transcript_635/g.1859 Transcript_635/m.1859 type:complete len:252 (+) Transcript_635:1906-2661(+)